MSFYHGAHESRGASSQPITAGRRVHAQTAPVPQLPAVRPYGPFVVIGMRLGHHVHGPKDSHVRLQGIRLIVHVHECGHLGRALHARSMTTRTQEVSIGELRRGLPQLHAIRHGASQVRSTRHFAFTCRHGLARAHCETYNAHLPLLAAARSCLSHAQILCRCILRYRSRCTPASWCGPHRNSTT